MATSSDPAICVEYQCFTTGFTSQRLGFADRGAGWHRVPFHALCVLIHHPHHGPLLFDTGYAPHYHAETKKFPYRIYGMICPAVTNARLAIHSQLHAAGVSANDLKLIILSHFHADHVAGVKDFNGPKFIASEKAWRGVEKLKRLRAVKRGFIPTLLPNDFVDRLTTIKTFKDPGVGQFEHSHDLFGDGSIRLIELPGHARGQIGALLRTAPDRFTFLIADATWTLNALRHRQIPHPLTFSLVDSIMDLRDTVGKLYQLMLSHPEIDLIPTHCPEVAKRFGFDEQAASFC